MKKVSLLLTSLVLVALLLTACGAATSTAVPTPSVFPVTSAATETEVVGTETTTPSSMTTTPGIPVTGEENPARLSNELDYHVWNQNGDQIGEVDDMVLDLDHARVSYVLVGTGGLLGIAQKEVLVPWDALQLQTGTGDAIGGDQSAFVLQADQNTFDNAPDTDINNILPGTGQPAGDWDKDIRNYWENGPAMGTGTPSVEETGTPVAGTTAMPGGTETASPEATSMPEMTATVTSGTTIVPNTTATLGPNTTPMPEGTASTGMGQVVPLQGVILASDVLNATINLQGGLNMLQGTLVPGTTAMPETTETPSVNTTAMPETTGTPSVGENLPLVQATPPSGGILNNISVTVDDVLVDTTSGDVTYLVVHTNLDNSEYWIPVPLSLLQWDPTNQTFGLNMDAATLQNAPSFAEGQYPDTTASGWSSEFDTFWQNFSSGDSTMMPTTTP